MFQKFSIFNFQFSILILLLAALPILLTTSYLLPTPISADWVFDGDSPTCSITFPFQTSPQTRGTPIIVRVDPNDTGGSGVNTSTITLSVSPASPLNNPPAADPKDYTWTPDTAGTYNFTCSVEDNAGNSGSGSTSSPFTINNPDCDTPADPACTACGGAAANTCSANNGTQTCTWNSYSGGGSCTTVTTTPQCAYNNCNAGYVCLPSVPGTCILPPSPPVNPTGSCPDPGTTASLSWGASATGTPPITYDVRIVDYPSTTKNFNDLSSSPYSFTPSTLGFTYSDWGVTACYSNTTTCSSQTPGAAFFCYPPVPTLNDPNLNLSVCTGNTYTGTLSWTGYPMYNSGETDKWGFWVNIKKDADFSPGDSYYQKWVGCDNRSNPANTCSTTMPAGFNLNTGGGSLGSLEGEITYYVRVYNMTNTLSRSFGKTCPPAQPDNLRAICPPQGREAILSWDPPSPQPPTVAYYNVRLDAVVKNNITSTSTNFTTIPNTNYTDWGVAACNAGGCSSERVGPDFYCDPGAWVQTRRGDVHSNKGINTPGGP